VGNLLIAHCPCGFKHSAGVGGGFLNHDTIDNEPALCPACDNFSIQNYIAKNHGCAKCGSRVVFYNDPSLMADPSKAVLPGSPVALPDGLEPIHYWAAQLREHAFILPDTEYLCPNCKQKSMKFSCYGNWD